MKRMFFSAFLASDRVLEPIYPPTFIAKISSDILKQLENTNKSICVELTDEVSCKHFLAEAKNTGFRFGDGVKPTERACGRVMVLKNDRTICYVGAYGTRAFSCNDDGRIRANIRAEHNRITERAARD